MLVIGSMAVALYGSLFLASPVSAQIPPIPKDLKTVNSKTFNRSYISYKETSICETTPGVKGYSGYVHLPKNLSAGRSYDINTFFWFFQARENHEYAPLAIWLQGGPGVPSVTAALGENGPCIAGKDSSKTDNNPWSWNQKVNMMYIDQPVQVGLSYSTLANGTIDQMTSPVHVTPADFSNGIPETNETFFAGQFTAQMPHTTASTTTVAAAAMWEFMQTWMQEFPEIKPNDGKFSVWTESYGGHYGPGIAEYFDQKNQEIAKGASKGAIPLIMETLGIVNGCIDMLTQMPLYPQMAFDNTYGLQLINQTQFDAATQAWPQCESLVKTCQAAYAASSAAPGTNTNVNKACKTAFDTCFHTIHDAYPASRNVFDITKQLPDDSSPKWAAGYLNQASVQAALGVPLNFTGQSEAVAGAFDATGDFVYPGGLARLEGLLNRGAKVALMYGDADYQCNWLGGEQVSLALKPADAQLSSRFHAAGYANITTNASYTGGVVRQAGNLSFSRVFNAGHEVPYYQPETAYRIFDRVMFDKDVATGELCTIVNGDYATVGTADVCGVRNVPDKQVPATCYMWDVLETCTPDEKAMLRNGTAKVRDFVLVN